MNRVPAILGRSHLILVVTCIVAAVVIDRYYFDIYNLAGSTCKIDDQDRIASKFCPIIVTCCYSKQRLQIITTP